MITTTTPWLLLCAIMIAALADAEARTPSTQKQFEQQLQACERDPQYRVGGAATGECLEAASAVLDGRIAHRLQALSAGRCDNMVKALADAQQHWRYYRHSQCGLYQAMFDNTAMYLNGSACRLRVTLQRDHELQQLDTLQPSLRHPCE